jgi:hypothetical protein
MTTLNVTCTKLPKPTLFHNARQMGRYQPWEAEGAYASLHDEEDDTCHAGGGVETGFIHPNLRPGDH